MRTTRTLLVLGAALAVLLVVLTAPPSSSADVSAPCVPGAAGGLAGCRACPETSP